VYDERAMFLVDLIFRSLIEKKTNQCVRWD